MPWRRRCWGGGHASLLAIAAWRRILNADRRGWVLIGECTSDTGVHVHRNAISMCAPAFPYVAGCLTVAARPPERRRRSGALGRRWERPPLLGCLYRHRGVAPGPMIPAGRQVALMKPTYLILLSAASAVAVGHGFQVRFPAVAYRGSGTLRSDPGLWRYSVRAVAAPLAVGDYSFVWSDERACQHSRDGAVLVKEVELGERPTGGASVG